MEGDIQGDYRTIPIVYGIQKTKTYLYVLTTLFLLGVGLVMWKMHSIIDLSIISMFLLLPSIVMIRFISTAAMQQDFHRISKWIKFISVMGIATIIILLS